MNIEKFKYQHVRILECIADLRGLVQAGIANNAEQIAAKIIAMSGLIKLHLSVEDRILYPALLAGKDATMARMSHLYQLEMEGIVGAYLAFAGKWNLAQHLIDGPEEFRSEANVVLKLVYDRMKKEDHEFYPAIEAMQ